MLAQTSFRTRSEQPVGEKVCTAVCCWAEMLAMKGLPGLGFCGRYCRYFLTMAPRALLCALALGPMQLSRRLAPVGAVRG